MFVTVAVVLCRMVVAVPTLAPDTDCTMEEARIEEIVTNSDLDPEHLDFFGCQIHGQLGVSEWKTKSPLYHSDRWRIARIKCIPGHYEPAGRA